MCLCVHVHNIISMEACLLLVIVWKNLSPLWILGSLMLSSEWLKAIAGAEEISPVGRKNTGIFLKLEGM